MERNRHLLNAHKMEKAVTVVTIGLIELAAALNIFITLVMMVMEKYRDTAALMSMGAGSAWMSKFMSDERMRLPGTSLLAILVAAALAAQGPIPNRAGMDDAAVARWSKVLAEMHLSKDPELKDAVRNLRALNLYRNPAWVDLVNTGYAYLGDSEGARQFRATLARELPDSSWAVQAAIQQWESAHPPRSTSQTGFTDWGMARLEFLRRLHRQKPHAEAATSEYLSAALRYESRLDTQEALEVADLALQANSFLSNTGFQVARIYLDHRVRLDDVPGLLNRTLETVKRNYRDVLASGKGAEWANQMVVEAQFQYDCDLAEYWLEKRDSEQARNSTANARADIARLALAAGDSPGQRAPLETAQALWLKLAKRTGGSVEPVVQPKPVGWAKVARRPLGDFEATDLDGRRWTLEDWKGKVVLVTMWATWCPPCRAELPLIQKLHEALRGRADRLIISINVDSDADLARRLIREHGYSFPVLMSQKLADQFDFVNGLPQNRMVDSAGRMLLEPLTILREASVAELTGVMDQIR